MGILRAILRIHHSATRIQVGLGLGLGLGLEIR